MKHSTLRCYLALVLILIPAASRAQQWQILGAPWAQNSTNLTIATVGGITYFTHSSYFMSDGCSSIYSEPVLANGTNLTQAIYARRYTSPETLCTQNFHSDTHVSVLGALPPASYTFTVWTWYTDPFLGGSLEFTPYREFSFSVPAQPTISLTSVTATNGILPISIAGVPGVEYVLEASSSLTNWTAVKTNMGGPFTWDAPVTENNVFYRTRIIGH